MRLKGLVVVVLSMMLVYLPVAPAATSTALGQMTTRGRAEINGSAAPAEATIFAGDRISTSEKTTAAVTLPGQDEVLLPALTRAVLDRQGDRVRVKLERGSLAVRAKSSMPAIVEAGGARIAPAPQTFAVYEVAIEGNTLKVLAQRGTALVETDGRTLEVKEGTELNATLAPPQAQGTLSSLQTWTIIVAAAAGITGLALGVAAITRPNPSDCKVLSSGLISCP
jgi:ferric-dicitrate binding protein FerR (iron transport regulator)